MHRLIDFSTESVSEVLSGLLGVWAAIRLYRDCHLGLQIKTPTAP